MSKRITVFFSSFALVRFVPVFLVILFCNSVQGQWQQISSFNSQIQSVYFLDKQGHPEIGFVGTANGSVWRTRDLGKTWQRTNTPVTLINYLVSDFTFKNQDTGWLSSRLNTTTPGIYKTTDGGSSWFGLNVIGDQTSITYNPNSKALVTTSWSNTNFLSLDEGATWTSIAGGQQNGVAYASAQNGIMSTYTGTFYSTADGGLSWQKNANNIEAWQPLGVSGSNTYFIAAERAKQILRTDDGGVTWNILHQFPQTEALSGDIRGSLAALFVQGREKFYLSTDEGLSWRDYCGPGNAYDTRFYVVGDTVYAGTIDGTLWWNSFGTTKNDKLLEFAATEYQFASTGCFTIDTLLHLINRSNCVDITITDVGILGSPTFTFSRTLLLPYAAAPNDSVGIRYSPDDLKEDSAMLIVGYRIDGKTYEKRISLKGKGLPGENITQIPKELDLLLASDCVQVDTSITIKSGPCDSLVVASLGLSDPNLFTFINPPQLPLTLPPGGVLTIKLHVNTTNPVNSTSTLTVTVTSNGTKRDLNIPLKLVVLSSTEPRLKFSHSEVRFDSVFLCSSRLDTIRFTNTLCKPLKLTNIALNPTDPSLSIRYQPALTRYLATGESDSIILLYVPKTTTALSSNLKLNIEFNATTQRDTTIRITGFGKAFIDAKLALGALAFDPILPCEQTELFTFLINHACDSLVIMEIIPPNDKGFVVIEPKVASIIGPGDSIRIRVHEAPVSEGAKFDSLLVRVKSSTGAEQWLTLKLIGTVNPKVLSLSLPDVLKLDSLAPCTSFDSTITIRNTGLCDTIIIDSIDLIGPNWFSLLGGPLLPHTLAPGESIDLIMQFTPGTSAIGKGSIRLIGSGIDTSVVLDVNSIRSGQPFILSIPDSVFHAFLCSTSLRTFTIGNEGCDTTIVDSISLLGGNPQFGFSQALQLPLTIAPGKTVSFSVNFDPSQPGDSSALLFIRSLDNGLSRSIQLTGTLAGVKQTAGLELMLIRGRKQTTTIAGDLDTVQLLLRNVISAARDLRKIEFDVCYYQNVLSVINPEALTGWTPGFEYFPTHIHITLTRSNAVMMDSNLEIVNIVFQTYIADSSYSPLWLDNIKFNDGDSLYRACVLEPLALEPVQIGVDDECGDKFIRGYIRGNTSIFDDVIIVPNPTKGKTSISFDLNKKSDVTLSMISATGATFNSSLYPGLEKGRHTLNLPNAKVAEGFYFVKVEAEGAAEIRKVVLIK